MLLRAITPFFLFEEHDYQPYGNQQSTHETLY